MIIECKKLLDNMIGTFISPQSSFENITIPFFFPANDEIKVQKVEKFTWDHIAKNLSTVKFEPNDIFPLNHNTSQYKNIVIKKWHVYILLTAGLYGLSNTMLSLYRMRVEIILIMKR